MAFVDEVQAWLRVWRPPVLELPIAFEPYASWGAVHRMLATPTLTAAQAKALHEVWTQEGFLSEFLVFCEQALAKGLGAKWSRARRLQTCRDLIGVIDESPVAPKRNPPYGVAELLELRAVRLRAVQHAARVQHIAWMQALGLLDAELQASPIARVLTRLRGREAVHLLLELETALAVGEDDALRVSRTDLQWFTRKEGFNSEHDMEWDWSSESDQQLKRLVQLGVLNEFDRPDRPWTEYGLSPTFADIVQATLDPQPNPIRALVQSLLGAERGALVQQVTGAKLDADKDLKFADLMVHELRNELYPMDNWLRKLEGQLKDKDPYSTEETQRLLGKIRAQIDRIRTFTEHSARLIDTTAPERFLLGALVSEAIAATAGERNGHVRVEMMAAPELMLQGQRAKWELMFIELIRNAARARVADRDMLVQFNWALDPKDNLVTITVDDDGPGIPETEREDIFTKGYSGRGSTGLGLYSAAETVQSSKGSIQCDRSPQGGARFVIKTPAWRPR